MWNLAFCFTITHRAASFKAYYSIRSFITFHGIFMAPGYEMGEDSVFEDSKWIHGKHDEGDLIEGEGEFRILSESKFL